mmetsp:Transcript_28790/g.73373  ORF Transcript_28790/g.73373 Transcript_28790/m.73373 type:complete len:463 (+) Transcript_28790:906-2294(+)
MHAGRSARVHPLAILGGRVGGGGRGGITRPSSRCGRGCGACSQALHLAALHQLARDLAVHLLQLLAQVAHARLAAVLVDERGQRAVRQARGALGHARVARGLRLQVGARDGHLLVAGVARQADDLHAVQQRARDGVQHVGGAHEQHLGQVDGHVQVVVHEARVLLGVQQLQQRGRGVARVAAPQLVDLVDQHQRVGGLRVLEALHHLAGHGAHVRAPVALDLGHVVQAAHAEAVVRTLERVGDGAADGRLAHARRAHQAQDLALRRPPQRRHRDELQDAVLDVLQPVVLRVQHRARMAQVERLGRGHAPGQAGQPLQVRARDVELGRHGLQPRQLVQLVAHHARHLLGRARLLGLPALVEPLHQRALVILLQPQLLLDGAQLLHEQHAPLLLHDLALHLLADVGLQLAQLHLLLEQQQHGARAVRHAQRLQHALQRGVVRAGQRRRRVHQPRHVLQVDGPRE